MAMMCRVMSRAPDIGHYYKTKRACRRFIFIVSTKTNDMQIEDPLFASCFDTVHGWASGETITPTSVLSFVSRVMAFMQTQDALRGNGARKKRLCLAVVRHIVQRDVHAHHRRPILALLQPGGVVDSAMDIIVSVARGGVLTKHVTGASPPHCCALC